MKVDYKNVMIDGKRILDEYEIPFFLGASTLLGIILEGEPFDEDIEVDFGVFWEDVRLKLDLIKNDKRFTFQKKADFIPLALTYINTDVKFAYPRVALAVGYRQNKYCYASGGGSDFQFVKFSSTSPLTSINFLNMNWNIPLNYESLFEELYGKDWRIRKKIWNFKDSPSYRKCETKEELDNLLI